jgi:riboflavin kinase / FMN adenylyltransferase
MNLYHGIEDVQLERDAIATIGMFDGVHIGHQALIRNVVREARAGGHHAAVVTFHPHPDVVLGRSGVREITPLREKARLVSALGADSLTVIAFTRDTMATRAGDFVLRLHAKLRLRGLWVGEDFALGKGREGNPAFLAEQGRQLGFDVHVLPHLQVAGERVSSTRVRDLISRGDQALLAQMLGRG